MFVKVLTRNHLSKQLLKYRKIEKSQINLLPSYQINRPNFFFCESSPQAQNKPQLPFSFAGQTPQIKQPQQQSEPLWLIPLGKLPQCIERDLQNYYESHQTIRKSFIYHLEKANFRTASTEAHLMKIITLLAKYPTFELQNQDLLLLYKIVCFNLHLKSVQTLNVLLLFVLLADKNISQSPIYLEFVKFYVQVPLEETRIKYQLDLENLSIVEAIKLLLSRIFQRGFFSRLPGYYRNLNVIFPEQLIHRLATRKDTQDDLIVKKLNYTIFMDVKHFYENQMHENLYNPKKLQLMQKFSSHFMPVLSKELPQLHNQNSHLRQLYMKLYLTLEEDDEKMDQVRYRNVIFLYRLAHMHVKRIQEMDLENVEENIETVIEFVKKVQDNFTILAGASQRFAKITFDFQQRFYVLQLLSHLQLQSSDLYKSLFAQIQARSNPYTFKIYFPHLLSLFKSHTQKSNLFSFFHTEPNHLSLLNLDQLHQLTMMIKHGRYQTVWRQMYGNVLEVLLMTDYQVIGGQELILLLEMFQKHQAITKRTTAIETNCQILRKFVLRYLADHYQDIKLAQLETLLNILLGLPHQFCQNFDDEHNNYPLDIFHEMDSYLTKVELLFNNTTLSGLHGKRQKRYANS